MYKQKERNKWKMRNEWKEHEESKKLMGKEGKMRGGKRDWREINREAKGTDTFFSDTCNNRNPLLAFLS
jgi:hypothetical protein